MKSLRVVTAVIGFALAARSATGQAAPAGDVRHERSSAVPEARYEIVQSALTVRVTLRFDRFTGTTWQLVQRGDSSIGWSLPTLRLSHPERDTQVLNRANYEIHTSGLALSFTFLVNVNTGATWQLKEDPKQGLYWDPVI